MIDYAKILSVDKDNNIGTILIKNLKKIKPEVKHRKMKVSSILSQLVNFGYNIAEKRGYDYTILVVADILLPQISINSMLQAFKDNIGAGAICLHCTLRSNPVIGAIPMVAPPFGEKLDSIKFFGSKYYEALAGNGAMMVPDHVYKNVKWISKELQNPRDYGMRWGSDYQFCIDIKNKLNLKTIIITDLETIHLDEDGKTHYSDYYRM